MKTVKSWVIYVGILGFFSLGFGIGQWNKVKDPKSSDKSASVIKGSGGEPSKNQLGSSDSNPLRDCYLGGNVEEKTLFSFENKEVRFTQLSWADQTKIIRSLEESWIRQNRVLDELALRVSLSPEKISELPELADLAKENIQIEEDEIKQFYEANKTSFSKDRDYASVKETLRAHLKSQRLQRWIEEKQATIREKRQIISMVEIPCPPRVSLKTSEFPPLDESGENAVETVVFTNPFCQSCRIIWPQISFLNKQVKNASRIITVPYVSRDVSEFDLTIAKYQFCANKAGKDRLGIWLDTIHHVPINLQGDLIGLQAWVHETGVVDAKLVKGDFLACVESQDAQKFADKSRELSANLSLSSGPIILINGRMLINPTGLVDDIRSNFQKIFATTTNL